MTQKGDLYIKLFQYIRPIWSKTGALNFVTAKQSRINNCAGCTTAGAPAARGPQPTADFLPRCFDVT